MPANARLRRRRTPPVSALRSSHSPHHGGRADRPPGGAGSSAGDSLVASTAHGFRTPSLFAPVNPASAAGVHPMLRAVSTAGASLARWSAVRRQAWPSPAKNSPIGPPPHSPSSSAGSASRARAGAADGSPGVLRTVRVQPLHPVPAPVAPRRHAGCTPFPPRGATAAPRRLNFHRLALLGIGVR